MQDEKKEASCIICWFQSGSTVLGAAELQNTREEQILRKVDELGVWV